MTVDSAVKNPMDLPLVRVVQLNRWWGVYGCVGNLTRASGRDGCTTELGTDQVGTHAMTPSPQSERVPGSDGGASSRASGSDVP